MEPVPAPQGQLQQLLRRRLPHHGGRPLLLHGLLPPTPAGAAAHHPRRGDRPPGHPGDYRGPDARGDGSGRCGPGAYDPGQRGPAQRGLAARRHQYRRPAARRDRRVRPAPGGAQQGVGRGPGSRERRHQDHAAQAGLRDRHGGGARVHPAGLAGRERGALRLRGPDRPAAARRPERDAARGAQLRGIARGDHAALRGDLQGAPRREDRVERRPGRRAGDGGALHRGEVRARSLPRPQQPGRGVRGRGRAGADAGVDLLLLDDRADGGGVHQVMGRAPGAGDRAGARGGAGGAGDAEGGGGTG